jgi:hypothetical protein
MRQKVGLAGTCSSNISTIILVMFKDLCLSIHSETVVLCSLNLRFQ